MKAGNNISKLEETKVQRLFEDLSRRGHRVLGLGVKKIEKKAGALETAMGGIRGAVSGLAGAFGAWEAVNFLGNSIKEAQEAERATLKLESVLRSTGGASGQTAESIREMSDRLQSLNLQMMEKWAYFHGIDVARARRVRRMALQLFDGLRRARQESGNDAAEQRAILHLAGTLHEVGRVYRGKDPLNVELNLHEWHKHDFYMPVSFESTTTNGYYRDNKLLLLVVSAYFFVLPA
jgi:hypothetical protein